MKAKYKWYIAIAVISCCCTFGFLFAWALVNEKSFIVIAITYLVWFLVMFFAVRKIAKKAREDMPSEDISS